MAEKPATLNNLPPMPNPGVIDREQELEDVVIALLDPDIPIVTLPGPAGMGKTVLALTVAHRLREQGEFPGGIVWLNANAVQSPDEVWETIGRVLGLPGPHAVQRHLREYSTLLILDGLDEAAQNMGIVAFLDRLPTRTKALVTSRKPVGLAGKELALNAVLPAETVEAMRAAATHVNTVLQSVQKQLAEAIDPDMETWNQQMQQALRPIGEAIGELSARWMEQAAAVLPDRRALATLTLHIAVREEQEANYPDAIAAYRQALDWLRRIEQTDETERQQIEISYRLGVCLRLDGQWGPAVEQQEETFRQFKKLRDFEGQGRAYLEIARAYQAMNSYGLAVLYYRDAYRLFKRAGDVALAATAREEVGNLEYYLRILEPATADWEEAARLYDQANRPGKAAIVRQNLAQGIVLPEGTDR